MKSMLIAATAVGATIAGLILYFQRREKGSHKQLNNAENRYLEKSKDSGKIERPAYHAMG